MSLSHAVLEGFADGIATGVSIVGFLMPLASFAFICVLAVATVLYFQDKRRIQRLRKREKDDPWP